MNDPGDHPELLKGDKAPASHLAAHNAKLPAGHKPVQYTPILKGTNVLPLDMQTDWIARLQHTNLSRTVRDAAAEGWVSNIHGTHPIPGMAHGKDFGIGLPDAPWLY